MAVAESIREIALKAPFKRAMTWEEALGNRGGVIKVISDTWLEEERVMKRPERDGLWDDESIILKLVLRVHRIGRQREIRQERVVRPLVPGLLRVKVVKRLKRVVHRPRIVKTLGILFSAILLLKAVITLKLRHLKLIMILQSHQAILRLFISNLHWLLQAIHNGGLLLAAFHELRCLLTLLAICTRSLPEHRHLLLRPCLLRPRDQVLPVDL